MLVDNLEIAKYVGLQDHVSISEVARLGQSPKDDATSNDGDNLLNGSIHNKESVAHLQAFAKVAHSSKWQDASRLQLEEIAGFESCGVS